MTAPSSGLHSAFCSALRSALRSATMNRSQVLRALEILREARASWDRPYVSREAEEKRSPFRVLVSCILSLRTRDETTAEASKRLFARARSPRGLRRLTEEELAELIYPVGFYRQKARQLRELADQLLQDHEGRVPDTRKELLALAGVGPKTANLVLSMAFERDAICVDVHVHRIPNRWGAIDTHTPEESEQALMDLLPRREWKGLNDLLVSFGQNVCTPLSPRCSQCCIEDLCAQRGVDRHR